jgi:hypothetical protein
MPLEKVPDAILFPSGWIGGSPEGRLVEFNRRFGPILKVRRVDTVHQGNQNFVRPYPRHDMPGLQYPTGHPRQGESRHLWFAALDDGKGGWDLGAAVDHWEDQPDVLKFGYLKPDDAPVPADFDPLRAAVAGAPRPAGGGLADSLRNDPAAREQYLKVFGGSGAELEKKLGLGPAGVARPAPAPAPKAQPAGGKPE